VIAATQNVVRCEAHNLLGCLLCFGNNSLSPETQKLVITMPAPNPAAGVNITKTAEKIAIATPQTNAAESAKGIHPWQKQIAAIFEPGDYLHIKLIHGTETYIGRDGKPHPRTEEHWDSYEGITAAGSLGALQKWEREGWNIFICTAVFDAEKIKAAQDAKQPRRVPANIATDADGKHIVRCVAIDCDADGKASLSKIGEAVKAGLVPTPTVVIRSSTPPPDKPDASPKFHVWWATKDFTLEQQAALNAALQREFGGDPAAKDVVRVLRLAGFTNNQPKYKHKPVAELVRCNNARYSFEDFKLAVEVRPLNAQRPKASSDRMEFYCNQIENNAAEAGFELGDAEPYLDGFKWVQTECPNADEHTTNGRSGSFAIAFPSGARDFGCLHSHCAHLNWEWFKNHLNTLAGKELDWTDKGMLITHEQTDSTPIRQISSNAEPIDANESVDAALSAMEQRREEFAQLEAECKEMQDEPLAPYPVLSWEGTPYLDFAKLGRCEGTENQNFLPPEWLINTLMTYVGAICGHRISPAFNTDLKARFITILLSDIGGIGKDTVQTMVSKVLDKTDLIRLRGFPKYQRIGCIKSDFASERAMIQAQAQHPITLQVYGEFTTLIEKTGIQGSGQSFINLLLHYADSSEPKWSAIKDEGIPKNAPDNVEVSLVGFTTRKRWDAIRADLETFIQRTNIVHTDERRIVADIVIPDFSAIREAILPRIGLLETHKLCWDFTPEAKRAFRDWFQSLQDRKLASRQEGTDEDESEVYGRIQVYALRVIGHLALWLGELPATANIKIEAEGGFDGGFKIVVPEELKILHNWRAQVTPEIVERAIKIADYELAARARAIPPKGGIISALAENTIRRWVKDHGKIMCGALLRRSHLQERFGVEVCKKAVLSLAQMGDIKITPDPDHKEIIGRWLIHWVGASGIPAENLKWGGVRKGAGRKKR
jgi:RepB DNA-primase N-terminal domain